MPRRSTLSIGASADRALVPEPVTTAAVTTTVLLLLSPPLIARQITDVSAAHALASQAVSPGRNMGDIDACPIPWPYTVATAEPVDAWLLMTTTLSAPKPADRAMLLLPVWPPAVTTIRPLRDVACAAVQITEVSEVQSVASTAV